MSQLFTLPKQTAVDSSGTPYPGAKLYFYAAGTTTAQAVYSNIALTVAHSQPVQADANGRFPAIYLDPDAAADYRVRLYTLSNVLLYDQDNVPKGSAESGSVEGAGYPITPGEESAAVTPTDYSYPPGDARRYGVVGEGDETTEIQNLFSANAGGNVYFPAGKTYETSSVIYSSDGTTVNAEGAYFSVNHSGTGYLIYNNGYWKGGKFTGPGNSYLNGSRCFYITGSANGAGVAPTRVSDTKILDVEILEFGYEAIACYYVDNVEIIRPYIHDTCYFGIIGYSATRLRVIDPFISDISYETVSGQENAYGVSFTSMTGAGVDTTRYPISTECKVIGGQIQNIPTWHALDTHGGSYIEFRGVSVYNCRRGFCLSNSTTTAAQYCIVDSCYYDNELTGTNPSGSEKLSEAIWDIGISDTVRNTHNTFTNNVIINGGRTLGVGGAAYIEYSSDCTLRGNVFKACYNEAIYVGTRVRRLSIDGNTITNTRGLGTGGGGPSNVIHGVLFNAAYFENCKVTNNVFQVTNSSLATYMMNSAVTIGNYTTKSVYIDGNVINGVTSDVVFASGYGQTDWGANVTGGWSGLHASGDRVLYTFGLNPDVYLSLSYTKTGNMATIRVGGTASGSNSESYLISYLPSFLRPASPVYGIIRAKNAGTWAIGAVVIETNGIITLYSSPSGSTWTNGTASPGKGHESFTLTYPTK